LEEEAGEAGWEGTERRRDGEMPREARNAASQELSRYFVRAALGSA